MKILTHFTNIFFYSNIDYKTKEEAIESIFGIKRDTLPFDELSEGFINNLVDTAFILAKMMK